MPHPTQLVEMPSGQASATVFTDEAAWVEFLARLPDALSRFGRLGDDEPFRIRLKNVPLPGVSLLAGERIEAESTSEAFLRLDIAELLQPGGMPGNRRRGEMPR